MAFKRLFDNDIGMAIVSLILGLGLASLFRKECRGESCEIKLAPDYEQIHGKTFKFGEKCYVFNPISVPCTKNVVMSDHGTTNEYSLINTKIDTK